MVMNNFNRLLYTYILIFNKKILSDYNKKNVQRFCILKKMPNLAYQDDARNKKRVLRCYYRIIKNSIRIMSRKKLIVPRGI